MATESGVEPHIRMPNDREVDRAIKLTYLQSMLMSVFGASTGGMFLIGFAMKLGADDFLLGLMTTLPSLFIVFQLLGAVFVERGASRKRLTVVAGLIAPLAWFLIAAIPFMGTTYAREHFAFLTDGNLKFFQFAVLIGTLALASATMQVANAARGSWIGELIPEQRRGRFFGYAAMFGGIIAAVFSVGEGRFLDYVSGKGLFAFAGLFFFGSVFCLISMLLFLPQANCPLPRETNHPGLREMARRTVKNRPLVALAVMHGIWSLTAISAPFGPAYMLRDVGVSYFQLGVLNAIWMGAWLVGSPIWGKVVERIGSRPVMIIGFLLWGPCCLVWLAIPPGAAASALYLLPWTNIIAGFGIGGIGVATNTMLYKVAEPVGRSVQLALYWTFVVLVGAPMPLVGGWLVTALKDAGVAVDLRLTFYAVMIFVFGAAYAASRIEEPGSVRLRVLARYILARRTPAMPALRAAAVPVQEAIARWFSNPR